MNADLISYPYNRQFKWGFWRVTIELTSYDEDVACSVKCWIDSDTKNAICLGTYIPNEDRIIWTGKNTTRIIPKGLKSELLRKCQKLIKRYDSREEL